jgi:hypothetical protein
MRPRTFVLVVTLVGLVFMAAVYGADLGRGFVKDDVAWIATGVAALHQPASAFRVDSSGYFFRPLVTASFAADFALHGIASRGYGVTNLLLCLGCAGAICWLFLELGLGPVAVAAGVLAWLLNPHGIGMALLWISGRTSLLMTLCSTLSIVAFLGKQRAIGALLLLAALLAKEDAVAVPLLVVACAYAAGRLERREIALALSWMAAAVVAYAALRLRTSAMTPATAPWYYRLLTSPWAIAINGLSYVDRAGTGAALITLGAAAIYRSRPAAIPRRDRLFALAALWFVAGLAITVRVPVRSDLYAVFPSVGAALACAVAIDALRAGLPAAHAPSRDRAFAIALAALLVLIPVYQGRNARYAEPARLSARVQQALAADLATLPAGGTIVFEDAPARFATFGDAFGGMSTAAVQLFTGRPFTADIVMPPEKITPPDEAARYALVDGSLERLHRGP